MGERFGRDLQYSFYDVTNYYTEKDFAGPDETYRDRSGDMVSGPALGQKGVSKEHQLTPIIQMGLFMDGNSVPVCMDVFRGNMSDSDTLKEHLDGFKKEYGMERTVVVTDKGMNCSHNIDLLCSQGDGYVFSQVLKGTKGKRYQEALLMGLGAEEKRISVYDLGMDRRLLAELKRKQKKRGLEREELLEVLLSPLMGGSMGQRERIRKGLQLLRGERERLERQEAAQMEAVLYTFAMKFLTVKELKTIKEMMNMTILGEMIMQDGIEKGRREGKREGRREGKNQINQLNAVLIDEGRMEDLKRASRDKVFQDRLIRELLSEEKGNKGK